MAKLADTIQGVLAPQLEPGEQLRSVGYFRSGPFWAMMLLSNLFAFALKYYYAGITDRRLILVQLSAMGKPNMQKMVVVPLNCVALKGNSLLVTTPDKPKPQKYDMMFGIQKITGLDANGFKAAINPS